MSVRAPQKLNTVEILVAYRMSFSTKMELALGVVNIPPFIELNLELIIANNIATEGIGFNSDDNAVTVIDKNHHQELTQRSKQQLARDLIVVVAQRLKA
ncbi:MAG: hypothetical protein EOO68_01140 [Moraxellaceae bacterium]|nr:MAG: hypothetical protein EOO68_01140 [Moraxellaceae bacterium]